MNVNPYRGFSQPPASFYPELEELVLPPSAFSLDVVAEQVSALENLQIDESKK